MFPPIDPREIDYLPERMCCNSIAEEIRKLQKDSEYKINKQLLENAISLTKDIAYAVDLKSSFNSIIGIQIPIFRYKNVTFKYNLMLKS